VALERYLREDVETLADGAVRSKTSAKAVERDLDMHFYYSMYLHFPHLRCQALLVRPGRGLLGERGHMFSAGETAAIVAHIPQGRHVAAAGANHYTLLLDDEPPVAEPVRGFLEEVLVDS
jgi:hypothetical protein